jgi:hypothetical protein
VIMRCYGFRDVLRFYPASSVDPKAVLAVFTVFGVGAESAHELLKYMHWFQQYCQWLEAGVYVILSNV